MLLVITSGFENAFADACPTASASTVPLEHFDRVCQDALNSPNSTSAPVAGQIPSQKVQYCQSAKSALEASNSNGILWKVWAAVAGVCVVACAASFAGFANQYICMVSTAGAGVADAVVTKNFISAMMGLGSVGASYMINSNMTTTKEIKVKDATTGKETTAQKEVKKDVGACISAGIAGFQTYTNYSNMQQSKTTAQCNLNSAASVASSTPPQTSISKPIPTTTPTVDTTAPNYPIQAGGTSSGQISDPGSSASTCTAAANSGNVNMMTTCATASDSSLPNYVNSPRFANDFKKASGMDLKDFLSKDSSPGTALVEAGSGTLSSGQTMKLASAVKAMELQMLLPNSAYSSGGGGGGGGGQGSDPALGDILTGFMNRLAPNSENSDQKSGLAAITFANQHGSEASITEDRKLSIFDRITYRYYFVNRRMLQEGK